MLRLNGHLEVNQARCLEDVPEEQHLLRVAGGKARVTAPSLQQWRGGAGVEVG